ncbi:MAG TPA: NUDIX hydrolase, partial [Acidobacteriota bacterium]|nr:NUDIX hydrolase [Acidobacteriota bacterium]HND22533.1 NUDIX hydrolase [Acidobacteriota bacterium]HNG94250.1 NUDIX hydrolase [Acidobacteriota bacterium]HNH83311.1 NUDIX hydrolase [Acidobacteriota bacterium]
FILHSSFFILHSSFFILMPARLLDQTFLHRGRVFDVSHDSIELESGLRAEIDIVHHNGGAAVLPLFENGDVLLVKQYRHPATEVLTEIPAGRLEPGEDPLLAAERELEEETGWKAGKIEFLTKFYALPGYSTEVLYCYLATDLTPGTTQLDEDEEIHLLRVPFAEALRMVEAGEIKDAKTMMSVLFTARRMTR